MATVGSKASSHSPEESLWGGLWAVAHALIHQANRNARQTGMTLPQCWILRILALHGALSSGDLSRRLEVSLPTVTTTVDHLARLGYVRRARASDDRRKVIVSLTPKGRNRLEQFRTKQGEVRRAILKQLTAEEKQQLKHLSEKLTRLAPHGGVSRSRAVHACGIGGA